MLTTSYPTPEPPRASVMVTGYLPPPFQVSAPDLKVPTLLAAPGSMLPETATVPWALPTPASVPPPATVTALAAASELPAFRRRTPPETVVAPV